MWQDMDQRGRLIAAGVLMVLGALLLLNNLFRVELTAWAWIIALGAAAAAFAWVYAQDRTDWAGIAAYVFGAIAVLILLATQISAGGVIVPVYVLLAIAAPFVVGWWLNRQNWGLLIPAYVMVAIVGVLLLGEGGSDLVAPYVMGAIGLPFMVAPDPRRDHVADRGVPAGRGDRNVRAGGQRRDRPRPDRRWRADAVAQDGGTGQAQKRVVFPHGGGDG